MELTLKRSFILWMRGLYLKERAVKESQSSGRESASDLFAPCLVVEWASSLPYLADPCAS